jgi:hypothetical protein
MFKDKTRKDTKLNLYIILTALFVAVKTRSQHKRNKMIKATVVYFYSKGKAVQIDSKGFL